jgi:PAS domain S-box-containing protein
MPNLFKVCHIKIKIILLVAIMFLVLLAMSDYVGTSSLNLAKSASKEVSQTTLLSQVADNQSKNIKVQKRLLELLFSNVASDVNNLRSFTQNLFANKDIINTKLYWDSNVHLIHQDNNQLININTDISSLWSPTWMDVNPKVLKKIEVSAYLNEYFKPLLKRSKYTTANYFIGKEGFVRYYPRTNMIDLFTEDLRTPDSIFFKPATPEKNPQKKLVWTPLYKDPATQQWMISAIAPIYVKGNFVGVVGTDVTLKLLLELFINQANKGLNYSILLDKELRPIALPKSAILDIYDKDSFLDKKLTQQSLLDYDSDFKAVLNEAAPLEQGFRKVTFEDRNVYISFTRLTELDWFYAQVIDESEVMGISQMINSKIDNIIDNLKPKLSVPIFICFFILVLMANKFVKPIILLCKLTKTIALGNSHQKIEIRASSEVGQLIENFSLMQKLVEDNKKNLETQLEFQQLLMKTVNTPIFIENNEGILIDCNHAFAIFVGNSINEIKGRNMSEVVKFDFFEVNRNSDKHLIANGGADSFISKVYNAVGEYKDLVFEKNAYIDNNGNVNLIVSTFFDVTELNDAKQKAESFNEQLQLKVDERTRELEFKISKLSNSLINLNQTQGKLVESAKVANLGSLVIGISHELNTPLGVALTGISSIIEQQEKMKCRYKNNEITKTYFDKYLDSSMELNSIVLSNINRTAALIDSFKDVSGDHTFERISTINVSKYMQEIIKSISNTLKRNQVQVNIQCAQNITIKSYPQSFSQMITSLIINATTHAFSEPINTEKLIKIDITTHNNNLRVKFNDNGKGIYAKNIPRIFDPFFTTNRRNGSTGLGLSIVHNIVTVKLDGTITCCSLLGISTEFDIMINSCRTNNTTVS